MNLCAKSQRKSMNNLRGIKEHFEVIDTEDATVAKFTALANDNIPRPKFKSQSSRGTCCILGYSLTRMAAIAQSTFRDTVEFIIPVDIT